MSLQETTFRTAYVQDNEIIKANDFEFAFEQLIENVSKSTQMMLESRQDFVINGKVLPYQGMNVQISPIYGVCKSTGIPFGRTEATVPMDYGFEESSNGRVDIIEVRGEWETYDEQQRAFNDPDTDIQTYQYVDTKKLLKPLFVIKKGTEGSSVAPEVDTGYVKLAEVIIRANNSTITENDIKNITADIAGVNNDGWTTEKAITYNIGYISDVNERFRVQHNKDGTHKNNVINSDSLDIGNGSKQINANVLPIGGNVTIPTQSISATDSILSVITKAVAMITSLYNSYLKYGNYGFKGEVSISNVADGNNALTNPIKIIAAGDGTAAIKIGNTVALSISADGKLSTNGYSASDNNNLITKAVTDAISTALTNLTTRVTNLENQSEEVKKYTNKVLSTERYSVDNVDITTATTANITLSGLQTIDGIALAADQKILVKNQTNAKNNGIYTVNSSAWSRTTDYNTPGKLKGKIFIISKGTTNAGKMFYLPNETFINSAAVGSDELNFVEFIGSISPLGHKLAMRTSDGRVKTNTPSENDDSVNKGYMTINNLGLPTGLVKATCSTAAATAAKTVTLSGFSLKKGARLHLTVSTANTAASALTLNVNSTGAKTIKVNGTTTSASSYTLAAGDYIAEYDGTYWCLENTYMTASARTSGSSGTATQADYSRQGAYCSTAAATAAKVANMRGFVLQSGATFPITFTNANTAASALTLAINSTAAKPIYINNAASSSSNYTLPAGTYLCRYNGTNYYIDTGYAVTHARTSSSCSGNSATATKLATKRAINGTDFDGSAAITTSKWGTARDIKIQDSDGTNTGSAVSVDGSAAATLKLPATIKASITGDCSGNAATATSAGACSGNSATATKLQTARTINVQDSDGTNTGTGASFDGSGNATIKLPATIKASITGNCSGSSGSCTGNAASSDYSRQGAYCSTAAGTAAKVASMRGFVLQSGATFPITFANANSAASALTLAINSTAAKPIYINNAATSSSNYALPAGTYLCRYNGTNYYIDTGYAVTHARYSASCSGNAATATKLQTARTINVQDSDGTNTGTGASFDGSGNATIKLPATIKASITGNCSGSSGSCTGNSATATKLKTARTINIQDSDGTNTGTGASFDGSGNATIKLPATIKATITGNASTATGPQNTASMPGFGAVAYCGTAAATAAKEASCTGYKLVAGVPFKLYIANTQNASAAPTLDIESTGAKSIFINGVAATTTTPAAGWYTAIYDGTYYQLFSADIVPAVGCAICLTAAGTATKVATMPGFNLASGSVFLLYLKTTNTASSPKLNINGQGAKPIYVNNAAATTSNLTAGVYLVRYNGTNFYIDTGYAVTHARVSSSCSGNAATATSAGSCTGNSATATKLQTARTIGVQDSDGTNTGTGASFDGSGNATIKLPATIKATITGNASTATSAGTCTGNSATATKLATKRAINGTDFDGSAAITTSKWGTARDIKIQDSDGTNTGSAVSVDGSAAATLKLPSTIKASITGNCSGSSGSCTGNAVTSDYSRQGAYCTTDAATAAKVASMRGYVLQSGATFPITFTKSNTHDGTLTLKINDTTAKNIWLKNQLSTSGNSTLPAGTYLCHYSGTAYYIDTEFAVTEARRANYATGAGSAETATTATSAGACTGNAATATKLKTAVNINGTSFNGSAAITTSKWGTARDIKIQDSDGTNTGSAVSVDGSAAATLKLPSTIKANITGNCSGSSSSCTGLAATALKATGLNIFTCDTSSSTAIKLLDVPSFVLYTGARLFVIFANANTASSPKLNVNSTGEKPITIGSVSNALTPAAASSSSSAWNGIKANTLYEAYYDGTNWRLIEATGNMIGAKGWYFSSTSNYIVFTNGLKIQWSGAEVSANTNVTLPIPYTNSNTYSVQVSPLTSSANNPQFIQIGFRNKTATSFQTGYTNGTSMSWFAIGY